MRCARILLMTPSGAQMPLGEVADHLAFAGASMIRDEGGELTGYVYVDLRPADYGGYVRRAAKLLDANLKMPSGYSIKWAGEYEFELRARRSLTVILPIVFAAIFILLYVLFNSTRGSGDVALPLHVRADRRAHSAIADGVQFQRRGCGRLYRFIRHRGRDRRRDGDLSAGSARCDRLRGHHSMRPQIEAATIEGAVHRLRPKLMTVAVVMISLAPILWETGIGADVMKPIAAPIVGGMITSTIHVLVLVPVFFAMLAERRLQGPPETLPFARSLATRAHAPANRVPGAVADVLHHWPPACRSNLPGAPAHGDRMDTGHYLGGLCAQPVQDRSENRKRARPSLASRTDSRHGAQVTVDKMFPRSPSDTPRCWPHRASNWAPSA